MQLRTSLSSCWAYQQPISSSAYNGPCGTRIRHWIHGLKATYFLRVVQRIQVLYFHSLILNSPLPIRVALLRRHSDSSLNIFLSLVWRFSPDLIAILCGLLMSTDGPYGHRVAGLNTFWGVPCIVVAFMVISTLQRGVARRNLSRMFLESPPMNLLGYISYPTCKYFDCADIYRLTELQIFFNVR